MPVRAFLSKWKKGVRRPKGITKRLRNKNVKRYPMKSLGKMAFLLKKKKIKKK